MLPDRNRPDEITLLAVVRRRLDWMGRLAHQRGTIYLICIAIGVYGVLLRFPGLGRSLWLDEAWVANSVASRSLAGMFYYDAWLQSSPPLFLLLVRAWVGAFGLTNIALRAVPLLMGLGAALSMLLLCRRIFLRVYALLAWTLFVLSPVAIEYSRTLKQYSSELAASTTILLACTLYIQMPTLRRFWMLAATVAAGLLAGYGVAFILPGIMLMMCLSPVRTTTPPKPKALMSSRLGRAVILAAISGGTLAVEYATFIRPNSPAALRTGWAKRARKNTGESFARVAGSESYDMLQELPLNHLLHRRNPLLASAGVTIVVGLALAWLRFRRGRRKWFELQVVCLTPFLLLVVCEWLTWYPFTDRTTLFALPFLIVLLLSGFQLASLWALERARHWARPSLEVLLLCAIVVTAFGGSRTSWSDSSVPMEDAARAVSFLHAHVQAEDFLWVHASCSEVFKLYARIGKWWDAPAHYGHTGWPCCPRGIANTADTSSEPLVRNDFGGALPVEFSGKVWLLYTTRFWHWYEMADEPHIMRALLVQRGCVELPEPPFHNIAVSSFDCKKRAPLLGQGRTMQSAAAGDTSMPR